MQRMVPECPMSVCTISLDFGSTSHILMVLSAEPVMIKSWSNIFSLRMHLT